MIAKAEPTSCSCCSPFVIPTSVMMTIDDGKGQLPKTLTECTVWCGDVEKVVSLEDLNATINAMIERIVDGEI